MELPEHLSVALLKERDGSLALSPEAIQRISHNRAYLDNILKKGDTYYGVNTGFGSLCNVRINEYELSQLQENLVCSHACGMGDEAPADIVRLMLLLKVHGLGLGYSGVRPMIAERLAAFYNHDIIPVVYELGSLGASGDLAPLAHLSLPLIGKGWVRWQGIKMPATVALEKAGLAPVALAAKEGLALLNGTQFMGAYIAWSLLAARRLLQWADVIGAMSADAFMAKDEPFRPSIHRVRPHKGQVDTAKKLMQLLQGSGIQQLPKEQVQDPYSFRCMPQVHGATKDVADNVEHVLEIEINAVTDNPIVFHDEGAILSGGNFHGQPLALHADFLAIAMAETGSISERRTYLLVSGQRGLPPLPGA